MDIQTLFWNSDLSDMTRGFTYNKETSIYTCLICGVTFEKDIIYPYADQFFNAHKMVKQHIVDVHGGVFSFMMSLNKSYTSLSENQSQVLQLMHQGLSDQEIASELGITSSTIRNYRFKFKEKEKQAKVFLSIMANLRENSKEDANPVIIPHLGATQVDDRYNITEKDTIKTLENYFDPHGALLTFPSKEKKKIIILREIAKNFKSNQEYSEKEINRILQRIYDDYVLVRRYLIQYGFLDRKNDGATYWVK